MDYKKLIKHEGHNIVCVSWRENTVSLKCATCGTVLESFNKPSGIPQLLRLHSTTVKRIQSYLDMNLPAPDYGTDEIIEVWTVKFPTGYEADIKVVNTESGAYIDAVLFDSDGSEVAVCEPTYELLGEYTWNVGEDVYTVCVVKTHRIK